MTKETITDVVYREALLPGIGRVQVPAHMTDADILAELLDQDDAATKKKKTSKKS